jgi:hypothetical protein
VADFRVNVVRKHSLTKEGIADANYIDSSMWESSRRQGEEALKRLINGALENTSVTCVLVGTETYSRPWVRYEILKSLKRGNALFGVHINDIPNKERRTEPYGPNPFEHLGFTVSGNGEEITLFEVTGGTWQEYRQINGTSRVAVKPFAREHRGKGFSLSNYFPVYCWTADKGYDGFAAWVQKAPAILV